MVASPGGRGSGPLADLSPTEINRGDCRAEQLLPSVLSSDRVRLLSNPLGIQTVQTVSLRSSEVLKGSQGSNKVLKGPTRFTEVPLLCSSSWSPADLPAALWLLRTRRRSSQGLHSACIMFLARRNVSATVAPAATWG